MENQSIRFVLLDAGWAHRFQLAVMEPLRKRQERFDHEAIHVSIKAQRLLCLKCRRLVGRRRQNTIAITAVAGELIGSAQAIEWGVRGQIRETAA